jgi:hypothetical protein
MKNNSQQKLFLSRVQHWVILWLFWSLFPKRFPPFQWTGWSDWANFRQLSYFYLWSILWILNFWHFFQGKSWVAKFDEILGDFFHTFVWSHCFITSKKHLKAALMFRRHLFRFQQFASKKGTVIRATCQT